MGKQVPKTELYIGKFVDLFNAKGIQGQLPHSICLKIVWNILQKPTFTIYPTFVCGVPCVLVLPVLHLDLQFSLLIFFLVHVLVS